MFGKGDEVNVTRGMTPIKEIELDGLTIEMALWDTAADGHYGLLRQLSYPHSDVFLICFAIDCPTSFSNITEKVNASRISYSAIADGRALYFMHIVDRGNRPFPPSYAVPSRWVQTGSQR